MIGKHSFPSENEYREKNRLEASLYPGCDVKTSLDTLVWF